MRQRPDPLKVAVLGYGYWGPNLCRNILGHAGFQLVGIVDSLENARKKFSRLHPGVGAYETFEQLLESVKGLDCVLIATPPHTHCELALKALDANLHVLVEKPLCMNVAECDRVIEKAAQKKLCVMVDHTFLYHPAITRIHEEVRKGNLGELLHYDSTRINFGGFQQRANVLWDLAPHDLSILDLITGGRLPDSVRAVGVRHFDNSLENLCYVHMNYGNRFLAHLHLSWVAPVKIRTVLLGGDKKMVVYDENLPTEKVKLYDKALIKDTAQPRYAYRSGDMLAPAIPDQEALAAMLAAFHAYVQKGVTPASDANAGRRIVQLLECATESMKLDGNSVRVPESAKLKKAA